MNERARTGVDPTAGTWTDRRDRATPMTETGGDSE